MASVWTMLAPRRPSTPVPPSMASFKDEKLINRNRRQLRSGQGDQMKLTKEPNLLNKMAQNIHFWSP